MPMRILLHKLLHTRTQSLVQFSSVHKTTKAFSFLKNYFKNQCSADAKNEIRLKMKIRKKTNFNGKKMSLKFSHGTVSMDDWFTLLLFFIFCLLDSFDTKESKKIIIKRKIDHLWFFALFFFFFFSSCISFNWPYFLTFSCVVGCPTCMCA